eukprot:363522-Chlamydomonas_euryale.AAC.6
MGGWMGGWMDGWKDGWIEGYVDGWMGVGMVDADGCRDGPCVRMRASVHACSVLPHQARASSKSRPPSTRPPSCQAP